MNNFTTLKLNRSTPGADWPRNYITQSGCVKDGPVVDGQAVIQDTGSGFCYVLLTDRGQLWLTTAADKYSRIATDEVLIAVGVGQGFIAVLTESGQLRLCEQRDPGNFVQVSLTEPVSQLAVGYHRIALITESGQLWLCNCSGLSCSLTQVSVAERLVDVCMEYGLFAYVTGVSGKTWAVRGDALVRTGQTYDTISMSAVKRYTG